MKRKIVRQGGTALTITLPSAWCSKHSLKQGDEVEVAERGNELVVSASAIVELGKITLNVAKMDVMLHRVLGAAYKAGYDEVEILYELPKELEAVQKVLGFTCIGFEIVQQTRDRILIRKISTPEPAEFDKIVRKCFQTLIEIANDCLEAAKRQDSNELRSIALRDHMINKYCDFLRRLLNTGASPDFKKIPPIYYIVEQLERIGDRYRDMSNEFAENPVKLDRAFLHLFEGVNGFLKQFYDLFYKFDLKGVEELGIARKRLKEELKAIIEKEPKAYFRYLLYLDDIFENVFDSNGALIVSRI